MTRDEFIGKLRSIYVGEENAIDEIISEYDRLINIIKDLIKDIEIIAECEDIDIIKMQLRTCLYNKLKELKEKNNE